LWKLSATHFADCTKNPNAINSSYNHKKIGTTSKAWQLCAYHLLMKEKTQVRWVVAVRQRVQIWASVNNTPPKGSPSHVPD